jgi:copper chaperone CopZ
MTRVALRAPDVRCKQVRLSITGLSCAADAADLERRLRGTPGLQRVTVNPITETVYATIDQNRLDLAALEAEVARKGYGVRPHANDDGRSPETGIE